MRLTAWLRKPKEKDMTPQECETASDILVNEMLTKADMLIRDVKASTRNGGRVVAMLDELLRSEAHDSASG